jgi:integrase
VEQPKPRRARHDGGLFQKTGYLVDKSTGAKTPYTYWQATQDIPKEKLPAGVDRKRVTGSGHTKSAALEHLKANVAKFNAGPVEKSVGKKRQPVPGRESVAEWFAYWHEGLKYGNLSDIMRKKYEGNFRLHILPHIGHIYLDELTDGRLKLLFYRELFEKKKVKNGVETNEPLLSSSARLNIYKALSVCLNYAVAKDRINRSPLTLVDAPKLRERKDDVEGRTKDAQKLLDSLRVQKHPDYCRFLFQFLGLRRSERLGLSWSNIIGLETDEPELVIGQQIARYDDGSGWYLKEGTKTGKTRAIVIFEPFVSALKEQKTRLEEEQKAGLAREQTKQEEEERLKELGIEPKKRRPEYEVKSEFADLVFLQQDGSLITPNRDNKDWKNLLQAEGFDYWRAHLNRHITATLLASLEPAVPMGTVRKILGHESEAMGYYYAKSGKAQQAEPMRRYGQTILGRLIPEDTTEKI